MAEDPDPREYLYVSLEMKRKDQTKPYDGKKMTWIPDEKEGFIVGMIESMDGDNAIVETPTGKQTFKKDILQQVNPPKYEKCEDMSNMTYLNDASVLHNLKERYYANLIYTYSGLFCVAINPYKRFPIYTQRTVAIYKGKRKTEVPPHVFAISDGAYMHMMTDSEDQSMLITGESGAGKTENTKKVISYLSSVGATGKKTDEKKASLEDQIVQTNPVLESFGNAKTTRNDNSSRFGKFIRIHFSAAGKLSGCDIETYLLEKARVISQQPLERSYHIFYQLMSGKIPGMKQELCLSDDIYDYYYVSQGKIEIPNVDDGEEMLATDVAFDILGFDPQEKNGVYRITAAVMHFGTMKFKSRPREEQAEPDGTEEGERVAKLLGLDSNQLIQNLVKPKIKVGTEFVTKGQSLSQVNSSIGALAKAMFDRLFKYLVKKCNDTLDTKQARKHFIGVLDIAGFEIFDYNGFEQLCINFTNEKLQQFFNHHMFVLEQEEYKREGIDWVFIDFGLDLQACIELIEKPMGILSILEEESIVPKASDKTFEDKLLAQHLGKSKPFEKPRPPKNGAAPAHFAIAHYAGTVSYSVTGWLDKNKDPLNDCVIDQFKKGNLPLLQTIFADHPGLGADAKAEAGGKGGRKKGSGFQTVSGLYKEQLGKLMATLHATHPHFVRCIIPNEMKQPRVIDAHLVMHQLTCNGVLEGIRICRKGFPNRMVYSDFRQRYTVLAPNAVPKDFSGEPKEAGAMLISQTGLDKEDYRIGHTKVFFRAGVLGRLEEMRDERVAAIMTMIQSAARWYQTKKGFQKLKDQRVALMVLQRNIRKFTQLRNWAWWKLFTKVKPMLNMVKAEDEIKALEEKVKEEHENFLKEEKLRKDLEAANAKLVQEKNDLFIQLEAEKSGSGDIESRLNKAIAQKNDLENQLRDMEEKLKKEESNSASLNQAKKQVESDLAAQKKKSEDLQLSLQKAEQDKSSKENQLKALNEEIAQKEDLIAKINREKKTIQEQGSKTGEELAAQEQKVASLDKLRQKLERNLEELEAAVEKEKKGRAEAEKNKRKLESELKACQEQMTELEASKKDLEAAIAKKDKEVHNMQLKLDEEQSQILRLQKQIQDLNLRVEEVQAEAENERQGRQRAERSRADLMREIESLGNQLEEAGGLSSAQVELNQRREAELVKLRRELDDAHSHSEQLLSSLRQKNHLMVSQISGQLEECQRNKARVEKERTQYKTEAEDMRSNAENLQREKANLERQLRAAEAQMHEYQAKLDEANRTVSDHDNQRKKTQSENSQLQRHVETLEGQLSQLLRQKSALAMQSEEFRKSAEEEGRAKNAAIGKIRSLEHEVETLRSVLEEDQDAKANLQHQLSKAMQDAHAWKHRFEAEATARISELDDANRKLQSRLQLSEDANQQLNAKIIGMEKAKNHLQAEMDDMHSQMTRAQQLAVQLEKRQRAFDKIIEEWRMKTDDLSMELEASQKECRNYSTEVFKLRAAYEEAEQHLEAAKRENKNLQEEVKEVFDRLSEGGKVLHDLEKSRRKLEMDKEELHHLLAESELALEQEAAKVSRAQLEVANMRQEVERRLQEKEEEFDSTRKNHQRALDSMQMSLETESRAKAEALRVNKKLTADLHDSELALDASARANEEAQKSIKKYQQALHEAQAALEDETRNREQLRQQFEVAERKANELRGQLSEAQTLAEQAERARRALEQEMVDIKDHDARVSAANDTLSFAKKKIEAEMAALQQELEELMVENAMNEERAKKATMDASRLADELKNEQEHATAEERHRKAVDMQMKELQHRLTDAESCALKSSRQMLERLESRVKALEAELDAEQRRHTEAEKVARKAERTVKEMQFQSAEDKKNYHHLQDLCDKLEQKVAAYKRKAEECEEIAAMNLAKYNKAQQEVDHAEERAKMAEMQARLHGAKV